MVKSNKKGKKYSKKNLKSASKKTIQKSKLTKNNKKINKVKKAKNHQNDEKNIKHQARLKLSKMVVKAKIENGDQWDDWLDKKIFKNSKNYQLWLDGEMENNSVGSLPDFLEEYEYTYNLPKNTD